MTGELSKAPKPWRGNSSCASKMESKFVPSDVSFGDIRHPQRVKLSSVLGVLKAVKNLMRMGTECSFS